MGVKKMEALELAEVLGSLMSSVVDAQAEAAKATVDFVSDVGFEENDGSRVMRMVKLRYRKKDENGVMADFEVEVPLLAMVNIPALAVSEAKLSFSYDVVTAQQSAGEKRGGAGAAANRPGGLLFGKPARLKGFVRRDVATSSGGSGKVSTRSVTAIDLDVTLAQQEMPIGVERLFDLAELGIEEKPVD